MQEQTARNWGVVASGPMVEKQSTLTDKAIRVRNRSHELLQKLISIQSRLILIPPAATGGGGVTAPPPDHALFATEAAQQALDDANAIADKILDVL